MPTRSLKDQDEVIDKSSSDTVLRSTGRVRRLLIDRLTASITAAFEERGIPSMLLKGPAFARLLYELDWERPYFDTDLLVQDRHRPGAEQVLLEAGFERVDRDEDWCGVPKYARTFRRRSDGAAVDLHWSLSGTSAPPEEVWSTLIEHTGELEVGGRKVVVLDQPASALLIALHNAHHGTRRPQTLIDVDRAIERLSITVWSDALRLADQLGAAQPFAAGLRLTRRGNELADRLGLGEPASVDMWLKTNPSSNGAWVLDRFANTRTLRGRLHVCVRVLVPPAVAMRKFVPLARRGGPGLALAYLLRPMWLVLRAGPAGRDWLRARRAVRAKLS